MNNISEILKNKPIAVIGAGAFGTSMAKLLAENGHDTLIFSREKNVVDEINSEHTNSMFLKNASLPNNLIAVNDSDLINQSNIIINAVPTQYIRSLYNDYNILLNNKILVNCSKGIETGSLFLISQIFEDEFGVDFNNYVDLTGPSHAEEVMRQLPTTVVAASIDHKLAVTVQDLFSNKFFRVYSREDVIGAELGGALKNVIALAAGVADGLGLGDNTKAALLTRGLAEMRRLGIKLGAKGETFAGLSGLGDLFVTCNSRHSRNRSVGERIGKGSTLKEIQATTITVAEGVFTCKAAYELSIREQIDMPISEQMYKVLYEEKPIREAIENLMKRDYRPEWE